MVPPLARINKGEIYYRSWSPRGGSSSPLTPKVDAKDRFSAIEARGAKGVDGLYAATSPIGALCESVLRRGVHLVSLDQLGERRVARLEAASDFEVRSLLPPFDRNLGKPFEHPERGIIRLTIERGASRYGKCRKWAGRELDSHSAACGITWFSNQHSGSKNLVVYPALSTIPLLHLVGDAPLKDQTDLLDELIAFCLGAGIAIDA